MPSSITSTPIPSPLINATLYWANFASSERATHSERNLYFGMLAITGSAAYYHGAISATSANIDAVFGRIFCNQELNLIQCLWIR